MNDFTNYEDDISDIDEVAGTDIKINPDYYIHNAILKAQTALTKENVKDGFLQYYLLIEHIEDLCKAAKMIPEDYETKVSECTFKDTDTVGMVKRANFKLRLLMSEIFNNKIATEPMKL